MGSPKEHPVSHIAYGYATQVVILDESGKVTEVVAAHDVGTVINVQSCEGQVEGGVVMGLGYAFTEDFPMVDGRPVLSYGKLGLFRATAAPDIKTILVTSPEVLTEAYGAKGVGDLHCSHGSCMCPCLLQTGWGGAEKTAPGEYILQERKEERVRSYEAAFTERNGCKRTGKRKKRYPSDGEIICRVDTEISPEEADEVVILEGKVVFPGFIDAHTHFDLEVSGTVTADDFESGTLAAIAGGTTTIVDFATQNKGETLREALANWHKKADGRSSCDYGFHMAISDWNEETSAQIKDMIEAGVTTFKLYMTYPAMKLNDGEIYEVLKRLHDMGGIAGVHCENADIIDALIREAKITGQAGCRHTSQGAPCPA